MKTVALLALTLVIGTVHARADFSYTQTRKNTGGMMAAGGANQPSKYFFRGQKMKAENGDTATVIDFDAQTITTIDNAHKTVTVRKFGDMAQTSSGVDAKIDVKETGQKKVVNGFNANELLLTMTAEMPQGGPASGMKIQMEMDMWLSPDVPGAQDLRAFYRKNESHFPWAAMAGGNPQMQAAMADMQRKIASMDGIPVLQIVRVKPMGGAGMPQMPQAPPLTGAQNDQLAAARARLEAMAQQGGPAAAAAQQALARMGAAPGGPAAPGAGGASGALVEITMESTGFSTAAIPDSTFEIPAGYEQK